MQTKCARCGAVIDCQPEGNCWCAELPRIPMPVETKGCLCRTCLEEDVRTMQKTAKVIPTPGP
jgi:hypothetical protein